MLEAKLTTKALMERRTQVHKDMKARKVSEEREKIIHEQQTDKQSEEDKLTAEDANAVQRLRSIVRQPEYVDRRKRRKALAKATLRHT